MLFITQWSFLVSRSSSPFQEISVGGYLQAPPFSIIPAPLFRSFFLFIIVLIASIVIVLLSL